MRYSYDTLGIFDSPTIGKGWVFTRFPSALYEKQGIREEQGTESYTSYPKGLESIPKDASEWFIYEHVGGGAAGERDWRFLSDTPGSEEEAKYLQQMCENICQLLDSMKKDNVPEPPDGWHYPNETD